MMKEEFNEKLFYSVMAVLKTERHKQFEKWGNQKHNKFVWIVILLEELGEMAKAALHDVFGGYAKGTFREEAIHTAAVAIQIIENIMSKEIKNDD